jgi:hypothetical protein
MDMHRKKFLQLAAAAPLALLLHPLKGWAINDGRSFSSNENVIYFTKGDAEYETLRKGFNKRIDKYPKVIAKCLNEKGVAEAAKSTVNVSAPSPPARLSEPPNVLPPAADKPETNVSLPDVPVS